MAQSLLYTSSHRLRNFIGWLANLGNSHRHLEALFRNETQKMRGKWWQLGRSLLGKMKHKKICKKWITMRSFLLIMTFSSCAESFGKECQNNLLYTSPHILRNFIGWLATLGNFHRHVEAVFRKEMQYMRVRVTKHVHMTNITFKKMMIFIC